MAWESLAFSICVCSRNTNGHVAADGWTATMLISIRGVNLPHTSPLLTQPLLWSHAPDVKPQSILENPLQTCIPPRRACLFDDNGSVVLPPKLWTNGTGLHRLIRTEKKRLFWGSIFLGLVSLVIKFFAQTHIGHKSGGRRTPSRRRNSHNHNRCQKETICLPAEGRSRHVF